ncbi:MAG: redoxin domain-containing protein [Brevefilum sp.]|nr:redoxin domain-containing protein [Brevefilum sp.]
MKINTSAPQFTLKNSQNEKVSLNEILSEGNHVILVFLRHLG